MQSTPQMSLFPHRHSFLQTVPIAAKTMQLCCADILFLRERYLVAVSGRRAEIRIVLEFGDYKLADHILFVGSQRGLRVGVDGGDRAGFGRTRS